MTIGLRLIHGNENIFETYQIYAESNDIIRYLDAEFPDPPLTPHSNSDRILMDRLGLYMGDGCWAIVSDSVAT